jgi:hypothetical protein
MASTSNIEILERFQSKALGMIVDTSLFVPNTVVQKDLKTPMAKDIHHYSCQYIALLRAHPKNLAGNLTVQPEIKRLQRHLPNDLPTRFLV